MKAKTCLHPISRQYTWFAYGDTGLLDTLCICCCDCGAVLQGAASGPDDAEATPASHSPSFCFYDNCGKQYQLTHRQVVALVGKHRLPKRRIYGNMAVESTAWDRLMQELGIPLAPGYQMVKEQDHEPA